MAGSQANDSMIRRLGVGGTQRRRTGHHLDRAGLRARSERRRTRDDGLSAGPHGSDREDQLLELESTREAAVVSAWMEQLDQALVTARRSGDVEIFPLGRSLRAEMYPSLGDRLAERLELFLRLAHRRPRTTSGSCRIRSSARS